MTRPASLVGKAPDLILGGLGFESDSRRSCSGGRFRPSVCEAVGAINASPEQRTELFPATTRGQKPRWSYLLGLHPHYLGLHPHYSGVRRMTSIHPHYSGVRMKTSRSILTTPGHPHLSGQPKKKTSPCHHACPRGGGTTRGVQGDFSTIHKCSVESLFFFTTSTQNFCRYKNGENQHWTAS